MTEITGGCLCGAVRYAAKAAPITVRECWCRDCQYWASGSATVNIVFESDKVSFTGDLSQYDSKAASGNQMHRGFCTKCGTAVTSAADARPHLIIIRAGTLDDTSLVKPEMVIWTSSAPGWAVLTPNIPHFEKGAT